MTFLVSCDLKCIYYHTTWADRRQVNITDLDIYMYMYTTQTQAAVRSKAVILLL